MSSFTLSISTGGGGGPPGPGALPPSTPVSSHTPTTPSVRVASDASSRLNEAERLITDAVSKAVGIIQELSKEKAVLRNVQDLIGEYAENVTRAEAALLDQIAYLQRFQGGHVFESSAYGAVRDAEIAEERLQLIGEIVRSLPTQSEDSTSFNLLPPTMPVNRSSHLPMDASTPMSTDNQ